MTETEWLAATDPKPMLEFLRGKASDRKLRLFACACCRQMWHLITDSRSREAVEVAERYAIGLASDEERQRLDTMANEAVRDAIRSRQTSEYNIPEMFTTAARAVWFTVGADTDLHAASGVISAYSLLARSNAGVGSYSNVQRFCSATVRELFGNPFHHTAVESAWLTSDVIALSTGIYQDRAFDRMPILADALQDAGCDNDDILTHCRDANGVHVRGCWALDLILGKE